MHDRDAHIRPIHTNIWHAMIGKERAEQRTWRGIRLYVCYVQILFAEIRLQYEES